MALSLAAVHRLLSTTFYFLLLDLEGPDVHGAIHDPGQAALVGLARADKDIAALIDGGASRQERHGKSRPAIVRKRAEARIADANLVVVDAVDQPTAAA